MAGRKGDAAVLYTKEGYESFYDAYKRKEEPLMVNEIYAAKTATQGDGDKKTQQLGPDQLVMEPIGVEGSAIDFSSPIQGWQYFVFYKLFKGGINLGKRAQEDTTKTKNRIKDLAGQWGRILRIEEETLGARPFNEGGNLSGDSTSFDGSFTDNADPYTDMPYDNAPLFNLTGNPRTSKGGVATYYNSIAAATISAANFKTMWTLATVTNAYDERDQIAAFTPDTLLTQAGDYAVDAWTLMNTPGLPGGQMNDKNPWLNKATAMTWRYLKDTANPWYVGKRKHPEWEFIRRQRPEIRYFRDEKNLDYMVSINTEMAPWIRDWRVWCRCGGTAA